MSGSTIATTLAKEVIIGTGGTGIYLSPLTVTATGRIAAPAPNTAFQTASAIYVDVSGGSIVNRGVITGAVPSTGTYVVPAVLSVNALDLANYGSIGGQSGVYLQNGGTITNSGAISGANTQPTGGYGVRLIEAQLVNSGTVYGSRYGAAGRNASQVVNTGSIAGKIDGVDLLTTALTTSPTGTLSNSGKISGGIVGVFTEDAVITNSGTISGQTYGIRSDWGGTIRNYGLISGTQDGVFLLNQRYRASYGTSFINYGTISASSYGLAINFSTASNTAFGLISGGAFGAAVGLQGYLISFGSINGSVAGLAVESSAIAVNGGTISSPKTGVEMFSGSIMTNASSGYISSLGTAGFDQAGYLRNFGIFAGNVYGLEIQSGGIALNGGTITSTIDEGVYLSSLSATSSPDFLLNDGYIYGRGLGVNIRNGTAFSYGGIMAQQVAVSLATGTSLNNYGNIYGGRYGVQLAGGSATNSGSIGGHTIGVRLAGGYLTTAGTIAGGKYAIYGSSFALTVDPGAVFGGTVVDKKKASKLILAGSTPGTLANIGTAFSGFSAIAFKPGANWLISGTTAALAANQVISGFEIGDEIVVTGFSAASESFVTGKGLELIAGSVIKTLDITGSFTTANFSIASSGTATTIALKQNAPCFAGGTRILTIRDEVAVEELRIGDILLTHGGEERPVIWIGVRTIDTRRHPRPLLVQPVCIAPGALADDIPRRELRVSPDHAMLIDDVLVPAQLLLNGLSIYRAAPGRVTYYHIELAEHAVLFAEHAPAESYLETGNRCAFENGGESFALHPDFAAMVRREKSCAPLLLEGKRLERIRQRLLARYRPRRSLGSRLNYAHQIAIATSATEAA